MFTEQQLEHIKSVARKKKNQGELSVWEEIFRAKTIPGEFSISYPKFTFGQEKIIKYCAEECKRQHSGEMSVYDMINAWNYASDLPAPQMDFLLIEEIGKLVEPIDNKNGFRTIPIGVSDPEKGWIEKAEWQEVPRLLTLLLESYYEGLLFRFSPGDYTWKLWGVQHNTAHFLARSAEDQFYYEYENIHPFRDGNGRSGKILYNYLLGRLDDPVMPPNFWGGSNP